MRDLPDSVGQLGIGRGPRLTLWARLDPSVEGRALNLHELTQPLHLEGVLVVGDELEAAHQFVSPAKYLAADRRIRRSALLSDHLVPHLSWSALCWARGPWGVGLTQE